MRFLGRASLGQGVHVAGKIRIKVGPGGRVTVGDGVRFISGFAYNPVGNECVNSILVGRKGVLNIASGAGLSATTLVCEEAITIGENTYIGGGTRIYDTDFHSLDPAERIHHSRDTVKSAPITIGRECFIGGHVIILKGVTIGDQSVIGAGSVVAKDIPPRQVWAGNPARFIKDL